MIKEKQVKVKIGSWTFKHYNDLGYENIKKGETILVNIEHLTTGSHTLVTAICEVCETEKTIPYKSYLINKNNNNIYNCHKCCYDIMKVSLKKKYGVENVSFIPEVKEKIRIKNIENSNERFIKRTKTNLERYGVENAFQSEKLMDGSIDKVKKTNIKNGVWIDDSNFEPWLKYKRKIINLTHKLKKELYKKWDGYDYYDNEYIKDNFELEHYHSNYPNVDHKTPIKYGFENNIPVEEIADISNLCITKKCINVSKYTKTEEEYRKHIN